jgi:hypothetical protein
MQKWGLIIIKTFNINKLIIKKKGGKRFVQILDPSTITIWQFLKQIAVCYQMVIDKYAIMA